MPSMSDLDDLDARILLALDDDPDATTLGLARALGVARNTVQARLKRLSSTVLRGFGRRVDPSALGYPLVAFVSLRIAQAHSEQAVAGLRGLPEVVEIHSTSGAADLLVRIVARDTTHLYRVTNRMLRFPGVQRSDTAISLAELQPLRTRPLLERAAQTPREGRDG